MQHKQNRCFFILLDWEQLSWVYSLLPFSFIGSYSQGGALALYTAFTADVKFGGIIGLNTWLPLNSKFPAVRNTCGSTLLMR